MFLGTAGGQLLFLASSPFLSRIYNEEDFAILGSVVAISNIGVILFGGRYHPAIIHPKFLFKSKNLLLLVIRLSFFSFILALLVIAFLQDTLVELLGNEALGNFIWVIPFLIFFQSINQGFVQFFSKLRKFKIISVSKNLNPLVFVAAALIISLLLSKGGLALSRLSGVIGVFVFFIFYGRVFLKGFFSKEATNGSWAVAREYSEYPKFNLVTGLMDVLTVQLLVLIIGKYYSPEELGLYNFTFIVLAAPIVVVTQSVREVMYQKMGSLFHQGTGLKSFFLKSSMGLFGLGALGACVLIIFGEDLFAFTFGEQWRTSGVYAAILAWSLPLKIMASPLSAVLNVTSKVKWISAWQVSYFVITLATVIICIYFQVPVETLLLYYVLSEVFLYGLYYFLSLKSIKK